MLGRFVHRHLLLPAFESGLKRRKTLRYWAELERSQWLNPSELGDIQLRALKALLAHAFKNCPHYRDAWTRQGLNPANLDSLDEFHRWPVTDRETVAAHRADMRAPGMKLIPKSTGGSSGSPLQFDLDHDSNDRRTAAWHRGYSWAGAAPGSKQLYLWGVPLAGRSPLKRCKDALYDRLYRRRVFNCFDMNLAREQKFVRALNTRRPDVLVAYTNPLYELARSLKDRHARPYSPRAIVVGAEKLHAFQRELIESVFSAPVFETYGSREFMLIGAECDRHAGLHLTQEHLLVEILDDDGHAARDGEEGNVVITDLYNYGMPFIRYANGDRAVAASSNSICPCGRGLATLQKVTGRRLDVLTSPDGRRIPGEFFPHLMKEFSGIKRFQVIQERPDTVRLRIVANDFFSPQQWRRLERCIRQELGPALTVDVQMVDEIPLTTAGKLQVVINRIDVSARAAA
jgi:phenylacetate-CoA ligase